jgi:hypothetical protein
MTVYALPFSLCQHLPPSYSTVSEVGGVCAGGAGSASLRLEGCGAWRQPADLKAAKVSTKAAAEGSPVGQAQELLLSLVNQGQLYFQAREGEEGEDEEQEEGSELEQAEPEGSYQMIDLSDGEEEEQPVKSKR